MQCRERRCIAKMAEHRSQIADAATCRMSHLLHGYRGGSIRVHKFLGSADIGRNRTEPARVFQSLKVIVWDAQQHQRKYQIGKGRQRDRVVSYPVRSRRLVDEEIDLLFRLAASPLLQSTPGANSRRLRNLSSSMPSNACSRAPASIHKL